MNLKIASNLSLPVDTVTQSLAILARKRAGKSYLARGFAERLLAAKQQVVILDPKGDWWGIRSSADGKSPGFPVVVLGGEHGDLPLEKTAAETIARLVVEERVSVLIDLSSLRKKDVAFFLGGDVQGHQDGFLELIYRLKAQEKYRTPLMLIADEADAIAPQKPYPGEERMLGAMNDIVRRGGQRGIGSMLVTQRSAVVNKDVLTQTQVLIAMRTIAPQDMDAMMAWVELHGTAEQIKNLKASLPSLPTGDAWVLSPGWPDDEGIYKRIHGLPITTFDSGATPKAGEKRVPPKTVADVDMDALQRRMVETIERAKASNPKELQRQVAEGKKRIAELERVVLAPSAAKADPDALKKEFDRGALSAKKALAKEIARYQTAYEKLLSRFTVGFNAARERLDSTAADLAGLEKPTIADLESLIADVRAGRVAEPVRQLSVARPAAPQRQTVAQGVAADTNANGSGDSTVGNGGLRKILIALAQRPQGLSTGQIGTRANISSKSGSFDTYLSKGRSQGWLVGSRACLQITDEGIKALGTYSPLPEGPELLRHWVNQLGTGGAARILQALADAYPGSLTAEELGIAANISSASGSFDTYLSKLRTLELITGARKDLRASAELFS